MKPPNCKLCKSPHWTYEEHQAGPEEVRKLGAGVLRNTVTKPRVVPTPPTVPTEMSLQESCACGKPREGRYKTCSACRKRAYRSRHGD
ncbi:hypothetical protein LCGC14_2054280 [marine sediment metagenome]|uniref:Uncharacterized protein n=1 Tax=marine sediment metagenome TaxID=412755 RepID=A0A0F9EN84_9ZZZZ